MPTTTFPEPRLQRRQSVTVARALGSSTRAGMFDHLQEAGTPLTVREVAATFDVHPNVARTHLETLADAGLVVIGRRKHPGGGRPAKVYRARDDAAAEAAAAGAPLNAAGTAGDALLVRLLAQLLDDGGGAVSQTRPLLARAHDAAANEGRRLVAALVPREAAGNGDGGNGRLEAAAQRAVRALRGAAPQARVVRAGAEWVDIAGVRGLFQHLDEVRPELADALERGLLGGAMAAAGAPVTLTEAGPAAGGSVAFRARAAAGVSSRSAVAPAERVDARGLAREAGVVQAMRAVTQLQRGDVLEVLAEGPGSPAAFARWADRGGHELLGVERAVDESGRPAIRLLIRKGL